MSDIEEVKCSFTTFPDSPDNDLTISGRVVLYYIWPTTGRNAEWASPNVTNTPIAIVFRDGDASGEILHKCYVVPGSLATAFNRQSCGEGGILFPNGLYAEVGNADSSDVWKAYIAGITLIYGGG